MGVLSAFLHPVEVDETKKVVVSKRFIDENGNPVPFEIKPMSQEENQRLTKKFTRGKYVNGNKVDVFDSKAYTDAINRLIQYILAVRSADSASCSGTNTQSKNSCPKQSKNLLYPVCIRIIK